MTRITLTNSTYGMDLRDVVLILLIWILTTGLPTLKNERSLEEDWVGLIAATLIVASHAYCAPGALICEPAGGLGGLGLANDLDLNLGLNLNHGLGMGLGGGLPLHRLGLLKKHVGVPIVKPLPIIVKVPVPVATPQFLPAPLPAPVPVPPPPPPAPLPKCGCVVPSCACLTK